MSSLPFENLKLMAQAFVGQLLRGDFTGAVSKFDETMKIALGEAKLQESWQNIIADA